MLFMGIVPLVLVVLCGGFDVPIPSQVVAIYCAVVYIVGGILIIAFAVLEKFGFAEEGYRFAKRRGLQWSSKKETKESMGVIGGIVIAVGVLFAVLAFIYR